MFCHISMAPMYKAFELATKCFQKIPTQRKDSYEYRSPLNPVDLKLTN